METSRSYIGYNRVDIPPEVQEFHKKRGYGLTNHEKNQLDRMKFGSKRMDRLNKKKRFLHHNLLGTESQPHLKVA